MLCFQIIEQSKCRIIGLKSQQSTLIIRQVHDWIGAPCPFIGNSYLHMMIVLTSMNETGIAAALLPMIGKN